MKKNILGPCVLKSKFVYTSTWRDMVWLILREVSFLDLRDSRYYGLSGEFRTCEAKFV